MDKFTNKDGLHTAAIYGFKLMLDHVLQNFKPDAALVAFDAGKVTFDGECMMTIRVVETRRLMN